MIPGSLNPIVMSAQQGIQNYQIQRSLRLRSSASAYLSRTFGTPTDNRKFTLSLWAKRGSLGSMQTLFSAALLGNEDQIAFTASDTLRFYLDGAGSNDAQTTAVFRDPSAHYHIIVVCDTANATATDRAIIYVNSVRQTVTGTPFALNTVPDLNGARVHSLARYQPGASQYFDGYLSEVYFIDGQALTPSSFGQTDANGVWTPKQYSGTYGNNGFYLKFNSGLFAGNLGLDNSGNGNDWTVNNISVSAGTTYDWMTDTPTNNYAVLNPLAGMNSSFMPTSNGNLQVSPQSVTGWQSKTATFAVSSGKWYVEFSAASITAGAQGQPIGVGFVPSSSEFTAVGQLTGDSGRGFGFYIPDTTGSQPQRRISGSNTSVGAGSATATSDVFMVAFDASTGSAWFGRNGTWYAGDPAAGTGASVTGLSAGEYVASVSAYRDNTFNNVPTLNFGQRPFAYTPPAGFNALCTANMPAAPIPNGRKNFDVLLHTATGSGTVNVTGAQFAPDLVWAKARNDTYNHVIVDRLRGVNNLLSSNLTNAESTNDTVSAFLSNGFTAAGTDNDNFSLNCTIGSTRTYVDWLWKAGGAPVSNTAGSITSQVSANVAAGFSIVKFDLPSSGTVTIGHGLGKAPKFIATKKLNSAENWNVWIDGFTTSQWLYLNTTGAVGSTTNPWGAALPNSTTFGITVGQLTSGSPNNQIALCFTDIAGFSKMGRFTANGNADGPNVITGFKTRWLMIKRISGGAGGWAMLDTARSQFNPVALELSSESAQAESATLLVDITANGFKVRNAAAATNANSSSEYFYMAFAENPFGGSNVAPATAR